MTEDDPDHALYNNLLKCLYAHNPIKECVAGTVESIAEITDKTLYHCHSVFYNPSNMNLSVVGNVDPETVIRTAKALLPQSGGEVPERDYGEAESPLPCERRISAKMAVSAPQFLFGGKLEPAPEGDARLRQMLVGRMALHLLFSRSSKLYNTLYEQGLLNGRFDYELDYTAGTAMFLCGGESGDIEAVKKAYEDEIVALAENGIDEERFQNVRKAVYGSDLRGLGSFSGVAHQLCQGTFERYCPLDEFRILLTVTAEEVQAFIASNITPEKTALSVVEPEQ